MSNLILHHYPMSPFSQKIRTMLGYAQLSWQSSLTREMPSRPVLEALAGGYRRIPVAQIGADVFCDSKAIAAEIAALSGKPALALDQCSEEVQRYVHHVEQNIFIACVIVAGTKTFGRKILASMSLLDIVRFFIDRVNIGRKATVKSSGMRNPKQTLLEHLAIVEEMLTQDFLFGAQPNHADFSNYHCLWFVRELGESPIINGFPKVIAWMDRMKAFGEGSRTEISNARALEIAKDSAPRKISAEQLPDPLIGKSVVIAPADYAQDPAAGILVAVTPTQWIIARESKGLNTLHVHFPRTGFRLTEA